MHKSLSRRKHGTSPLSVLLLVAFVAGTVGLFLLHVRGGPLDLNAAREARDALSRHGRLLADLEARAAERPDRGALRAWLDAQGTGLSDPLLGVLASEAARGRSANQIRAAVSRLATWRYRSTYAILGVFALAALWVLSVVRRWGFYNRGWEGWALTGMLGLFYVTLYWTGLFDDLVHLAWPEGSRWEFYGFCYSIAVLAGGLWFIHKNRRSPYQRRRTWVIIGVQLGFAFSIPILMKIFLGADYYFSYLWPLKIDTFYPGYHAYLSDRMKAAGHPTIPQVIVAYSFLASLVAMPILAFFLGKRWYCSWICGCGGLANTFGDPWRHLSSKTRGAWRFEMVSIHAVLGLALVTTAFVMFRPWLDQAFPALAAVSGRLQAFYGFVVTTLLSGMLGTTLYPTLGNRVWCRFFCPMAALLGLLQQAGRYRIRINGALCMACGNCSKYCEMGIDVRRYAMRGEDFRQASCVGCGLCAHVCPRGVLRLENGSPRGTGLRI